MILPFPLSVVAVVAERRGISVEVEEFRYALQLRYPGGAVRHVRGRVFDLDLSTSCANVVWRKFRTSRLAAAGLPVPAGDLFGPPRPEGAIARNIGEMRAFAEGIGFPVYAKAPAAIEAAASILVDRPEALEQAAAGLVQAWGGVYVQERRAGLPVGAIVLDGEVVVAYEGRLEPAGADGLAIATLPAGLRAAAATTLASLGLRFGAVGFLLPPGRDDWVVLSADPAPDLGALWVAGGDLQDAVGDLIDRIVVAMEPG